MENNTANSNFVRDTGLSQKKEMNSALFDFYSKWKAKMLLFSNFILIILLIFSLTKISNNTQTSQVNLDLSEQEKYSNPQIQPTKAPSPVEDPQIESFKNKQGYSLKSRRYDQDKRIRMDKELFINGEKVFDDVVFPIDLKKLNSFWFDNINNVLYTVESKDYHENDVFESVELFVKYSEAIPQIHTDIKILSSKVKVGWEKSEILDYENGKLLIITQGGDGCGGTGKIWLLNNNQTQDVVDIGGGCVDEKLARYSTYSSEDNEFLLSRVAGMWEVDLKVVEIYKLNPFTKEKNILLTESEIPENIGYLFQNEENKILLNIGNGAYLEFVPETSNFGPYSE